MTYTGTNTYVIEGATCTIIDPGPKDPDHLSKILSALNGRPVSSIILTHSHIDHSALAPDLAQATQAPTAAFGDSSAGRSDAMNALVAAGMTGGGEGIDPDFAPDIILNDGDTIDGLTVLHTPGHMGNHICLFMGTTVFTGDHVMDWATSIVSPPDGDLTDFMASCQKLLDRPSDIYLPGHGDPVTTPHERVQWLINHRNERERQIIAALDDGAATAIQITERVYTDVNPALIPAAARNVLAHLIDLQQKKVVEPLGPLSPEVLFSRR
jgi:glyoxylase-like metal-dependent hydrolase (beta-lactamase superfamily II)